MSAVYPSDEPEEEEGDWDNGLLDEITERIIRT